MSLPGSVKDVKSHIKTLNTFFNLKPDYYAVENGAADIVAKGMGNKMKVNQLRKFFTQIKRIELDNKDKNNEEEFRSIEKVYPLLPELAYAKGRGLITEEFYELMKVCMDTSKLKKIKDFKRLVDFLSAILAYHKMRTK